MGAKRVDTSERSRQIAAAALPLFVERPREEVTLAAITERAGMTYWQVVRAFGNPECVYRAAVGRMVNELAEAIANAPRCTGPAPEAIRAYAAFAAALIGGDAYRHFLYLLIRDRCAHPWLEAAYRERLVAPLREGLRDVLAAAGKRHGGYVLLDDTACARFVGTLEAALAVPKLIPGFASGRGDLAVAQAVREVLAASYPLAPEPAAA